jgi:uncharacterized membrane protein YsdA (DUF1294 family)
MAIASAITLVMFGVDKWRAGRGRARIAESTLLWACVLGGWPGGLAGMLLFRHKIAKTSFAVKFFFAAMASLALLGATLHYAGID